VWRDGDTGAIGISQLELPVFGGKQNFAGGHSCAVSEGGGGLFPVHRTQICYGVRLTELCACVRACVKERSVECG